MEGRTDDVVLFQPYDMSNSSPSSLHNDSPHDVLDA